MYKTNDELIAERDAATPGGLSVAKKKILRELYEREDREAAREEMHDNSKGRDDQ